MSPFNWKLLLQEEATCTVRWPYRTDLETVLSGGFITFYQVVVPKRSPTVHFPLCVTVSAIYICFCFGTEARTWGLMYTEYCPTTKLHYTLSSEVQMSMCCV